MDRVIGLEMGADDYICKPFSYREFQARIRAQLRHIRLLEQTEQHNEPSVSSNDKMLTCGQLVINPFSHEAQFQGEVLSLTATEFDLMAFLLNTQIKYFHVANYWNLCGVMITRGMSIR
jgi:DNA-binding response OmpR family regulator